MNKIPSVSINATFTHENPTGLGVYTFELTRALLGMQNELDLTAFTSSTILHKLYPDKVNLVSPKTSPSYGLKGHLLRMLWQQTILPIRLKKQKPDIFYSTVPEGMLFPSIKQVVTLHDIFPVKVSESKAKMRYHFLYTLPILLRNSRAIICVSEYTKQDVIDYYRIKDKPIFVIYEGIDKQKFYRRRPGIIKKKYGIHQDYLLYIGDMRPYKNIERTLEAFKLLDNRDYLFVIGGRKDPRFYPSVKQKVEELSLQDRVVIPGYIPESDLPQLYSEATAFILPSLYEGFGLPPLEAMACGCPVIVSNVTSLPEICGDAAFYINPYDIQNIADGISRVLTDEELRTSLANKSIERAQLFSWERTAREHIKVFEEVMKL